MKAFMDDQFLLHNETAIKLYEEQAKNGPIFDYHCHLNPQEIEEDKPYCSLTEVWLSHDHYKWRLMRACGIDEELITGKASDREKFDAYVRTIEQAVGNPLYHWSHWELKQYFSIDLPICCDNADAIWAQAEKVLKQGIISPRQLLQKSNVKALCTTDDPTDSLEYHQKLKDSPFEVKVLPTFRPDNALLIRNTSFINWLSQLEASSSINITSFDDFKKALKQRINFFDEKGCLLSDHSFNINRFLLADEQKITEIFDKAIQKQLVTEEEELLYRSAVLVFLGQCYAEKGWAMQLHLSVIRGSNEKRTAEQGRDKGFDAVSDQFSIEALKDFFNSLNNLNALPKTIVYSLNDQHNVMLSVLGGSFQEQYFGKIQLGSAWWFNDHHKGMMKHLTDLASTGVLGTFVGMLTDSRSFLSFSRHDYFRRILCNLLGTWIENGELFYSKSVEEIVKNICYNNINNYLQKK